MKIIDKVVEMVIEGLQNGTVPWRKTWKDIYPMNAFSKHAYRGWNVLLLSFLCSKYNYTYPFFASFKQISEAGGKVKKGEKAFPVVYWKITKKEKENPETGEDEITRLFYANYYNVFNLDQTEGLNMDKFLNAIPNNPNDPLEICDKIISNMPTPPNFTKNESGAFYRPSTDTVNVPDIHAFTSSQEYYSTMFHELAHATGHPKRLKRFESNKTEFGAHSYDYEELVAEMSATFLCSHCGIEQTLENSVAYLTGWAKFLKNERKTTLFGAATKAQAVCDYILGTEPAPEPEEIHA